MEDLPPQERGRRLLELVPHLTLDEVRQLRARLAEVDFRTDVFGQLPLELQCPIVERLRGRDIWPCLIVSRRWRAVFLADVVLTDLARRCFPGLLEYAAAAGRDAKDEFVAAARKYFFRSTGKFRSALCHGLYLETENIFKLHPGLTAAAPPHDGPDSWHDYSQILLHPLRSGDEGHHGSHHGLLYERGRLAWQPARPRPDGSLIVVDDLRSQLRKVFRYSGAVLIGRIWLAALGDQLVVGIAPSSVIAWDLESNQCEKISLPNRFGSLGYVVVTNGRTVGIVLQHTSTLLLWTLGRKVVEVDMTRPLDDLADLARSTESVNVAAVSLSSNFISKVGLIFHPVSEDVVFLVVIVRRLRNFIAGVRIYEFVSGRYRQSFILSASDIPGVDREGDLTPDCTKRDSYGLYTMAVGVVSENERALGDKTYLTTVSANFNACTRRFSFQYHRILGPTFPKPVLRFHWWNDQCTQRLAEGPLRTPDRGTCSPLWTINAWTGVEGWDAPSARPIYGLRPGNALSSRKCDPAGVTLPTGCDVSFSGLSHGLEYTASGCSCEAETRSCKCFLLKRANTFGDDDFLVLAHDSGYTVWAFIDLLPGTDLQQHKPRLQVDVPASSGLRDPF